MHDLMNDHAQSAIASTDTKKATTADVLTSLFRQYGWLRSCTQCPNTATNEQAGEDAKAPGGAIWHRTVHKK